MNTNKYNSDTHYLGYFIHSKGFHALCVFPTSFFVEMDLRDMEYQIGKVAPDLIKNRKIVFKLQEIPCEVINFLDRKGGIIIVEDMTPFDYFMSLKPKHRFKLELEEL